MRNENVNEPQNQQSCQTSVMVSADLLKESFLKWHSEPAEETIEKDCLKLEIIAEKFAIKFMCWCEENVGWINNYSNEEKMRIFKNEIEND